MRKNGTGLRRFLQSHSDAVDYVMRNYTSEAGIFENVTAILCSTRTDALPLINMPET